MLLLVAISALFTSCADSKKMVIKGEEVTVEPYGWANQEVQYNENVVYQINGGNIVWDILLCETIIVPVWLTGWQLYEPVKVKDGMDKPDPYVVYPDTTKQ